MVTLAPRQTLPRGTTRAPWRSTRDFARFCRAPTASWQRAEAADRPAVKPEQMTALRSNESPNRPRRAPG